jgi:hypothetical protein
MRSVASINRALFSVFVAELLAIGVLSSSVSARGADGLPVGTPQVQVGALTGGVKTVGGGPVRRGLAGRGAS